MMNPYVLKYRIWNLALRKNPQPATYYARALATAVNGSDTLTSYNLLRLTQDEPEANELAMAGATLQDSFEVWYIYQADLDLAGAPTPVTGYQLTFANGISWEIRNVRGEVLNQSWRCLCSQARPQ